MNLSFEDQFVLHIFMAFSFVNFDKVVLIWSLWNLIFHFDTAVLILILFCIMFAFVSLSFSFCKYLLYIGGSTLNLGKWRSSDLWKVVIQRNQKRKLVKTFKIQRNQKRKLVKTFKIQRNQKRKLLKTFKIQRNQKRKLVKTFKIQRNQKRKLVKTFEKVLSSV